jgi:branched-subunit amino acid permease
MSFKSSLIAFVEISDISLGEYSIFFFVIVISICCNIHSIVHHSGSIIIELVGMVMITIVHVRCSNDCCHFGSTVVGGIIPNRGG